MVTCTSEASEAGKSENETFVQVKRLLETVRGKYFHQIQCLEKKTHEDRKRIQTLTHLEQENESLRRQIQRLKQYIHQENIPLTEENIFLAQKHRIQQQERVIAFLRERTEGEKIAAASLQRSLIEAEERIRELEDQKHLLATETLFPLPPKPTLEMSAEWQKLATQNEELQKQCDEFEQERIAWQEKLSTLRREQEKRAEKWEEMIGALQEEKRLLQQALEQHDKEIEEKETRMKTAQQHLAKKVKENAMLAEELDRVKGEKREFESRFTQYENQHKEMQRLLSRQQEQEARSHDQWQEALRALEEQLHRNDEKLLQEFEKYKKLEERYSQMQKLFHNLSHIMHEESPPPT